MPWDETCNNMAVDGDGNLRLVEGKRSGYFETGSQDLTDLCWQDVYCICKVQKDPAGVGAASYDVEINTSEDNIVWNGWEIYKSGEYYCRYINMRVNVHGDPANGQRPKIVAFSVWGGPKDSVHWLPPVASTENNPPGAPSIGDRHLIGTGAGAWLNKDGQIAECVESDDVAWRYTIPKKGQIFYHKGEDTFKRRTTSAWVDYDIWTNCNGHIHISGPSTASEPAGTWATAIDATAFHNGYYDNSAAAANLDNVTYKVCLSKGTYTLEFFTRKTVVGGIVDIDLTDPNGTTVEVASFDLLAGAPTPNQKLRQTLIAVTVAGLYTITVRVDGTSGAGHECYIGHLALWRTA